MSFLGFVNNQLKSNLNKDPKLIKCPFIFYSKVCVLEHDPSLRRTSDIYLYTNILELEEYIRSLFWILCGLVCTRLPNRNGVLQGVCVCVCVRVSVQWRSYSTSTSFYWKFCCKCKLGIFRDK